MKLSLANKFCASNLWHIATKLFMFNISVYEQLVSTSVPIEKIIYHRLDHSQAATNINGHLIRMIRICGIVLSLLLILIALSGIQSRSQPNQQDDYAAFLPVVKSNGLESNSVDDSEPPPHTEYAKMARYLVHKAEWVSMGSISIVENIKGYPMVNIIAAADSERGAKSTGNLYFYLTMLDYTAQDLSKDNRLTVLLSMDQDMYCSKRGIDPMEPTCARIMISGRAVKLEEGTDEFQFGKQAMFSRHPAAKKWLATHHFFLCKLNITQIAVLDYYGGPHYVSVDEYMQADPETPSISSSTQLFSKDEAKSAVLPTTDERTITIKIKRDSPVRQINLEV